MSASFFDKIGFELSLLRSIEFLHVNDHLNVRIAKPRLICNILSLLREWILRMRSWRLHISVAIINYEIEIWFSFTQIRAPRILYNSFLFGGENGLRFFGRFR